MNKLTLNHLNSWIGGLSNFLPVSSGNVVENNLHFVPGVYTNPFTGASREIVGGSSFTNQSFSELVNILIST